MPDNAEHDQTTDEFARFHEAHQGDTSLWEPKPVRIRVRRGSPSTVFSLRLAPEELSEIFQAAEEQSLTTSDFIRRAALEAARTGRPRQDDELEQDLQSAQAAVEKALTTLREQR